MNVVRGLLALALLAGLAGLVYFVLRPGDDRGRPVESARIIEPPAGPPNAEPGVDPGSLARDFEASNLDGLRFRLSDLRGRPVVINFWATWCTSCAAEMPVLEDQRLAHEADDLAVVGVNVGEGTGRAGDFVDSLDLSAFSIAMDTDLTIADAFGVRGLPHSVFIDRNGVIRAVYKGQLEDDVLDSYVKAAIDAVPGGDAPFQLRLVNTVPREHLLEVITDEARPAVVTFASRRFRCDDSYCGAPIAEALEGLAGIESYDLNAGVVPATLRVDFDPQHTTVDGVVEAVADAVRAHPDELYTRELEVVYR